MPAGSSCRSLSSFTCLLHKGSTLHPMLSRPCSRVATEPTEEVSKTNIVIASFDRTFCYEKLKRAFHAVRAGARLIATNADRFRPTTYGGEPDAAAIIAAIEASSGVKCETVVGKPSTAMTSYLLRCLDVAPARCLLIGDRLDTDIAMANNAGISSALVLTGATSTEEAERSDIIPTYILKSLAEICI